jgi:ATP-dependent DNA helicase DinG
MDLTDALRVALEPHVGNRLPLPYPPEIHDVLVDARNRLGRALTTIASIDTSIEDAKQKKLRAQTMTGRAIEHIDIALSTTETRSQYVDFVSGSPAYPHLEIAPLDVGPVLLEGVWSKRTAILTSATIPASLTQRVGMPPGTVDEADVGSPFDYEHNALLYCALSLPDPRDPKYRDAVHDELDALITAAGGRTLALFTSWKAMDAAAQALKPRLKTPILTQRDLPKPALIKRFTDDESSTLLATAGFFQGVDVPGDTLIQVVIDRLPFPRPDDPLLSARRELLGPAAFSQIDLPRAAMMLAQAAGRLIRTTTDRGVVAVLDRRLGKANYRWDIVNALPPMRRTRHRADALAFLAEIVGTAATE